MTAPLVNPCLVKQLYSFCIAAFVLLCPYGVLFAQSDANSTTQAATLTQRFSEQRQVFRELKQLVASGEIKNAAARRDELAGYPLQNYFEYLLLRKEIESASVPADLLDRVASLKEDQRLHRRLLGEVKDRSVELSRWQDYKAASSGDNVPVHPCDDLLAGYKNGAPRQFDKASRELWVDTGRHTRNCDKAFAMLLSSVKDVPTRALWRRSVALVKRGKSKSARDLLKYFNKRDGRVVKAWIEDSDKPHKLLPSDVMRGQSPHHKEIATMLLRRWAREDLVAATRFWRTGAQRFGFSQASIDETLAKYAVLAAKRGMSEAGELLDSVVADSDVRAWRVRLALQDKDWKRCLVRLDEMSAKEQASSRWQYWRARCLESQGFKSAANKIYKNIAGRFEYYGFLASDKLQQDYAIKTSLPLVSDAELQGLKKSPAIARAIEYFLVDIPWEGRREWNRELKSSSKARWLAAAHLADSIGWYDRAHVAVESAGEKEVLSLLFPMAHAEYVSKVASRYSVPREFIYGVMRQESRFISDIKSSAGAVGLMQLMPATAKQMGEELGINAPKWKLIESKFNIQLGTKYLDHVLSRFDNNIAFAAAAYNAGPSRAKRWIADRPVNAGQHGIDLWVETIPFDETRRYVQAVVFNTVVSEWLRRDGSVTRINDWMNRVPAISLNEAE